MKSEKKHFYPIKNPEKIDLNTKIKALRSNLYHYNNCKILSGEVN